MIKLFISYDSFLLASFCSLSLSFPSYVLIPIPQNSSDLTNDVVAAFFVNKLALSLPRIPVWSVTQNSATLQCFACHCSYQDSVKHVFQKH